MSEHRVPAHVSAPERLELVTGWPNRMDGARVVVLRRLHDRIRVGLPIGPPAHPGMPGQPGTEVRPPSIELAVGDLLTLTRTWRVVSIEPEQPVVSDLPGAGSGQIAAVLELVAR